MAEIWDKRITGTNPPSGYIGQMYTSGGKLAYWINDGNVTEGQYNRYTTMLSSMEEFKTLLTNDLEVMPNITNNTGSKTTQGQGGISPLLIAAGLVLAAVWLK